MNLKYMKVSLFEISYKKKELLHDILIYWDAPVIFLDVQNPRFHKHIQNIQEHKKLNLAIIKAVIIWPNWKQRGVSIATRCLQKFSNIFKQTNH